MLDPDEVIEVVRDLWKRHERERAEHDRVYDYLRGKRGVPDVPDGAGEELQDLARMAVKNVLTIVVDAFAQNLTVHGFRSPDSAENEPVWEWWQSQRLDARQAEAHRPALSYGTSYAVLLGAAAGEAFGDEVRLRTPRQLFAVYEDPSFDLWPKYALETWIDRSGSKPVRKGILLDETHAYAVDLGSVSRLADGSQEDRVRRIRPVIAQDEDGNPVPPLPHGADNCPVVRFVNARDAEDVVVGEVAPLIDQQRAINAVNFDRLVVSRFGAFPQKYVIGWAPPGPGELAHASAARLMAFEDEFVKVGSFAQASVEPYNSILQEMVTHVAMDAQIPLSSFGSIINLSAEALAMAEAPHQRKLHHKRESFGESWEQVLRLAGSLYGFEVDQSAEVVWRETEVRSFAQVVDGIVKLAQAGLPIEELLTDVPGWTYQRVQEVRAALRRSAGRDVLAALRDGAGTPPAPAPEEAGAVTPAGEDAAQLKVKFDALGVAIRAGVDPDIAAQRLGLTGLRFTGAMPVSLRLPEDEARRLEEK